MKKFTSLIIFIIAFVSLCLSSSEEFNIKLRFTSKTIFYKPVTIKAYKNRIYILDSKAQQVKILSLTGKFIKSFGRKGEGPGEFIKPMSFDIYNDNIFVLDRNKVTIFDLEGNLIKIFRANKFFSFIIILNKKILLSDIMIIPQTPFSFYFYDINGNIIPKRREKSNKQINLSVAEMMFHMKYLFKINNNNFSYVSQYSKTPEYKLTFINSKGEKKNVLYLDKGKKIFKKTYIYAKGQKIYAIFKKALFAEGCFYLQPFKFKDNLYKGKFDIEPSNKLFVFNKKGTLKGVYNFPSSIKTFIYYKKKFFVIDSEYVLKIYSN